MVRPLSDLAQHGGAPVVRPPLPYGGRCVGEEHIADWATNFKLAHFLRMVDDRLVEPGTITPLAFRFAGRKASG